MPDIQVSEGLLRIIAVDQPQCFHCPTYMTGGETVFGSEEEDMPEFCSVECRAGWRAKQEEGHS